MAAKPPAEEKAPEADASAEQKPAAKAKGGLMPLLISSLVMSVILGGVGFALAYFVLPGRLQASAATPRHRAILRRS